MPTQITEFKKTRFSAETANGYKIDHDVYTRGSGPTIVIIQELPGIGQSTLRLADKFIDAGFEVVMPHLFGPIGKTKILANLARVFCLRKEFSLFSKNQSSPIVDWLKALCRSIRSEKNTRGVGVIGMCLTGNFAISLMADDSVLASVSSQPAMPFNDPAGLHMSAKDIAEIKVNIDRNKPIKAFRFEHDWMSKKAKFDSLDEAFNGQSERIQMNTLPGKKHSVFTEDFVDQKGHPTHTALQQVIAYFHSSLSD
ncbi:MAG: dienelactone hydrolase [Arenicella sp.]|jgi:dienelactone hydrolase